jgi:enoyl-CoA hydratase/carnithine racemase
MSGFPFDASLLAAGSVRVERDGAVVSVTLDDPERRNAQTPATWEALAHIGDVLPHDVAVVVVGGAGSSFSAGMDRRMFTPQGIPGHPSLGDIAAADDAGGAALIAEFQRAFAWWRDVPAITVSAVQGYAVGAGFQLALATDLMLVADDVQLVMKESAFGLVPDLGGTHPLAAAVGYRRALEICLTQRPVGAAEAVASGLAVRSVPAADLASAAHGFAVSIASLAPGTAAATKEVLSGHHLRTHQEQRAVEREAQMGRIRALMAALHG